MGLVNRLSSLILFSWVFSALCLRASGEVSAVSVKFLKAPVVLSSVSKATFAFEAVANKRGDGCRNCSLKCKLDNQIYSNCEAQQVSYTGLSDGDHSFDVCISGSQGAGCASYNWTVDTTLPTAYVTARRSFTNALNVSVDISFSEPCLGGGGFVCSSVSACNLLVYGPGHVIPSTFTVLQPGLKFSLLVGLSATAQYGRIVLVMDKDFCTDAAGNRFTRTTNSSSFVHFDRRNVYLSLRTHIPEKLVQLNSETRVVEATNNNKKLSLYLYFSKAVLNSTFDILSVLHTTNGVLLPHDGNNLRKRRFGYLLQNVSTIAVVTVRIDTSSLISRYGTPVSPTDPITFLYDSERPSVQLSTTSNMRTRECSVPVSIKFMKPVFDFNSSAILVSGGHLQRFHEVSRNIFTVDILADGDIISVHIPENVTGDVAGNRNLASNVLQVNHYSVPIISFLLSTIVTVAFAGTTLAAGFLTISTASLQSLGALARPSPKLTSEPTRNLFRIACHLQVFALSKWLAVNMPIEYYEFACGLQWSVPHITLPWESRHNHSIMVESDPLVMTRPKLFEKPNSGNPNIPQSRNEKVGVDSAIYGLPLTPMEYSSYFESRTIKPEAEFIMGSHTSNGWKVFNRNMFWLALIAGGLMLLHIFALCILKFRKKSTEKHKNYGALVLPRFEIFLIILALPCLCQASAAIIKGGSSSGMIVGIILLGVTSFLLLSLLMFLSIGITLGKLLQYKEVHQEGQKIHWYQNLVRVTLGPGKRGQWTWNTQSNSVNLTKLGPLFEDLRGPPKYMLSQIVSGNRGKRRDQIIASEDETEDSEAPFIQRVFGILRVYYTLLESVKRVALGIVAGAYMDNGSSKCPVLVALCISAFQLFFLVLKKPFIKKKVQLVEILSVTSEVGIFSVCLVLLEMEVSDLDERRLGIFMLLLFMIGFTSQMINEWYALYKQVQQASPAENSFSSGLKAISLGLLLILIPGKLLNNLDNKLQSSSGDGDAGETLSSGDRNRSSESKSSSSAEKPWLKQLRELAKASFSKEGGGVGDPCSSKTKSALWSGKRSGSSSMTSSSDYKGKSSELHKDLQSIFSPVRLGS